MLPTLLTLALTAQTTIRPPAIATVGGITLGKTTTEQFEKLYGKGFQHVGGHSNSGRTWYDETSGTVIDTDGFNYSKNGLIIDGMEIDWTPKKAVPKKIPTIKLPLKSLGILGKLKEGMTIPQIEKALGGKLDKIGEFTANGLIQYSEKLVNKDNNRYTEWIAEFSFAENKLMSFNVRAS